jgi:hypothetical protein
MDIYDEGVDDVDDDYDYHEDARRLMLEKARSRVSITIFLHVYELQTRSCRVLAVDFNVVIDVLCLMFCA